MPKSKTSLNELLHEIRRVEESRVILSEKKIAAIYRSLEKDLRGFVADEYIKYADEEGRMFVAYLDAKNHRAKFLQEIATNVESISPTIQKEIMAIVEETYDKSYKGMITALKKADKAGKLEAVAKDLSVNPNVLKRAINNNVSKLTLPAVLEKHRGEIIYQIQQELNIGLMQGDRYEKMAKRISERVGVSESKAKNIVRTETHRNIESGFLDCAESIQDDLGGSDLIYAATWRTMKDERVRPQQRKHTSKGGWKTTLSKNGANHMKMEGTTVKVGELFDLGSGVKTKAPSQSGVAAHDCNCRCFLEYNLMTVEEFAKATGQSEEKVRNKYGIDEKTQKKEPVKERDLTEKEKSAIIDTEKGDNVKLEVDNFPTAFTTGAEKKNTQKLVDYVNDIEGADPNALRLYASTGKLENLEANGIGFKISHASGHAVQTTSRRSSGELLEVKYTIPKFKGDNIAGQVNTTLHEQMHLLDLFGREDVKTNSKWFSVSNKKLVDTFKKTNADISDEVTDLFTKHKAEYKVVRDKVTKKYNVMFESAADEYREALVTYPQYKKKYNKLRKEMIEELDYESRNIMGGGVGNLQDIYDALSSGTYRANGTVIYGHGQQYYSRVSSQVQETVANYVSLSVTRPDLIDMLRRDKPELCEALDNMVIELLEKVGG